jgi:hypothetical protein
MTSITEISRIFEGYRHGFGRVFRHGKATRGQHLLNARN